jgi:antitoxin ParD1/3/4
MMNITLTSEMEQFVQQEVAAGVFTSADQVVAEALRLLKVQTLSPEAKLEALRQEVAIGIEQADRGEVREYDEESLRELTETIKERGRERLAKLKPNKQQ